MHAYIRSHSKRARTHITAKLLFVCLNLIHIKFWVCVCVCLCVWQIFYCLLFYVFDRFCSSSYIGCLLRMQKWICKIFSFIIDIISLVFVLLFQFPYVLTRFTLCNVAIYSMYNYLSLLTVPRSFCFCFILLLIRFLLTLSPFNCLQNKVFLL